MKHKVANILIGVCFVLFFITVGLFFVEGVKGIYYHELPDIPQNVTVSNTTVTNTTSFWEINKFIFESGGFAMHHLTENFFFCAIFSSSILFLPSYFDINPEFIITIWLFIYFSLVEKQAGIAMVWEWWEILIVWIFENIFFFIPSLEFLRPYVRGPEDCQNGMLSDYPQAKFAAIYIIILFHHKIIKPVSYLLYYRSLKSIIFRFSIGLFTGFLTLLTHVKKKYTFLSFGVNLGFYGYCFLKIAFLLILYIDDMNFISKKYPENKKREKEVKKFWIIMIIFYILQWLATGDLRTWGFISSNATVILYIVILYIFFREKSTVRV